MYGGGQLIEMATFAGPYSPILCEFDAKIFENPKDPCTKDGFWTGSGSDCASKCALVFEAQFEQTISTGFFLLKSSILAS